MKKTVFISSTYKDLKEYRKQIWDVLTNYEVNVRGMEQFGARTEAPLQTCLAEVEQADIFVCVISCMAGTIDFTSSKSYVQLEYEKAHELKKEIFIYLIDKINGKVTPEFIDFGENHEKLEAFKSILKERHTIDTYIDETDLSDKLGRKFNELLSKKTNEFIETKDEFERSKDILQKFLLLPKEYSSKEIKLRVKLDGDPFPASKAICTSFSFSYGRTIGIKIKMLLPLYKEGAFDFLFIDYSQVEQIINIDKSKEVEIYASPNFSENTIDDIKANFSKKYVSYLNFPTSMYNQSKGFSTDTKIIEAEGQMILVLKEILNIK